MTEEQARGIEAMSTLSIEGVQKFLAGITEAREWALSLYRRNQTLVEENTRLRARIAELERAGGNTQ